MIDPIAPICVIVSCEHGGNRISPAYQSFFQGHEALLASHRGYDPGALLMAKAIARQFGAPLFAATTSRLLIDLNRSVGHPQLFSEITRNLPATAKQQILARYYRPYRERVETAIADAIQQGRRVFHLSSHSFTPQLHGKVRKADIGLLYDPASEWELSLCRRWQRSLRQELPGLTIRRNYPYTGTADGFTAYLRHRFASDRYAGIELEVNQKYFLDDRRKWRSLRRIIAATLSKIF
ncbi:N-formylglutamate amidohydrolase [Nitrosomonas sp. sh817]|uniref:N-formylglutamate amidohydrolase n=1 Tax=Nitrosomonas sp. sh817 TaxID=3070658 RepID=UPI0027DDBC17|nr:N-formylglutamate amidohydrolase [Nitrosomonas sp. sh817]WMJ09198.1 N-formylglutamate amidohydrolase [Nitrosomonas sp. sh817]